MDDVDRSLVDIQPSPEELREQMVQISEHGFRRPRSRDWMSRLRFLIINGLCSSESSIPSRSGHESSAEVQIHPSPSFVTCQERRTLRLARLPSLKAPSSYVAVSYCWNRPKSRWAPFDVVNEPFSVVNEDGRTIEESAASLEVLTRSMAYAQAHNINAIWIDQECIDQSDPVDKENNIQVMDMVYQESSHPIVVLEFAFQSQSELDVFTSICDGEFSEFSPNEIELLNDVLNDLSDDEWFERAWTLQESVSAGVSMTLLLGCQGLEKSPHFGPTPGEFEIAIWDFQNAMVNIRNLIEEGLAAAVWGDETTTAISVSNCADVLWNYMPTIVPDFIPGTTNRNASHRQNCNAAQALTFLDDRFNSVFPDRLAILANLCNYEHRIPTQVLDLPHASFSICALTMSILNGDMSLLGGYQEEDQPLLEDRKSVWSIDVATDGRANGLMFFTDESDAESNAYGFSWGPKPSACLKNISYLEEDGKLFRLKPATLTMQGLKVSGILWDVNATVQLPETHKAFAGKWQEELAFQEGDRDVYDGEARQKPLLRDFLWSLLNELVQSGCEEQAKTIWNLSQPLGKDESYTAPLPYSFETVFGQSATAGDIVVDREDVRRSLHTPRLSIDPTSEVFAIPTLERRLVEQVCGDGTLTCGSPVNLKAEIQDPPYVWFEASKIGDKIFTPATNVGDDVVRSRYRNQAVSWRVLEIDRQESGCNILHCLGRRRGIWRTDGLEHRDYILD